MTEIEWTHPPGFAGRSWNPVVGCTHHGAGCLHCYADELHTKRHEAYKKHGGLYPKNGKPMPAQYAHPFTTVQLMSERLDEPLRTRKPTCWFVNSVSDLFHEKVPFEFIAAVYGVMAACPQHRFIILTKRPERMLEFYEWYQRTCPNTCYEAQDGVRLIYALAKVLDRPPASLPRADVEWPMPNVVTGVSIAHQPDADRLIPILLKVPSACRAISAEPLIGEVDVSRYLKRSQIIHMSLDIQGALRNRHFRGFTDSNGNPATAADVKAELEQRLAAGERLMPMAKDCEGFNTQDGCPGHDKPGLDWIIVGGESGKDARPCDVAWIRSIVQQCKAANVPCFVKQLGALPVDYADDLSTDPNHVPGQFHALNYRDGGHPLKDRKGGNPEEWPEDLRVRQFPAALTDYPTHAEVREALKAETAKEERARHVPASLRFTPLGGNHA